MIEINFNRKLFEQEISKLPDGCILRMSEETLMSLKQLYSQIGDYKTSNDFDFGEFIGYRIETYSGNGNISFCINPVMPLKTIQIQAVYKELKEGVL